MDRYLPEKRQLIQVAQNLNQPETRARSSRARESAMQSLEINEGLILTEIGENPVESEGRRIEIRSLAAWLLENS